MTFAIAFLLAVFLLCARLHRRFELVLPAAILVLMLGLTLLAMVHAMALIVPLVLSLCAALLLWAVIDIARKRITGSVFFSDILTYAMTPGLLLFIAVVAFYGYTSAPMTVWWRDDLAHWGLSVKSLWHAGGLVDGAHLLNDRFGDYPPGIQVLQWLLMHITGEWSEQALYFTLFLTYAIFLLPLFSKLSWRKWFLLPVGFALLVAFPTWGNVLSYVFLGIDTSLSLCFGYVLIMVWRHTRGDRCSLVAIALGLCGLFLIKQIGVLLAILAIALFLMRKADTLRASFAIALALVVLVAGWLAFCAHMGLSGYNTAGAGKQLIAMMAGTYVPPENAASVLPALLNALTNKYSGEITLYTAAPFPLPPAVWLVLLPLVPLLLSLGKAMPKREMRLLSAFLAGTFLVFVVLLYLSFFTTFYHETSVYTGAYQQNMVLLVERYLAPIVFGGGMLLLWLIIDAFASAHLRLHKPLTLALTAMAVVVLVLSTNWAVMAEVLDPDRYFQGEHSVGCENTVRDQETWGSNLDEVKDARVLIDLTSASDYTKEVVYSFAPAKFLLSTADNTASPEALSSYLKTEGVTHLVCLDEGSPLAQAANPLADEYGFYSSTLYAVLWEGQQVMLTEY